MRHSKSILLTVAVSIAFSTAAFAARGAETGHATMLSPIIIYPSDGQNKGHRSELRTGRSSSRTPIGAAASVRSAVKSK